MPITIVIGSTAGSTTQAANPHWLKKLPYDPIKDFAPVGRMVQGYRLMVVNPGGKANPVGAFIALAKKEPGKLDFGSSISSARVATEPVRHHQSGRHPT